MFGSIVQKLQESFSPVTSPVSSPKALRRRFQSPVRTGPAVRNRHRRKDAYRDVQSEPETDDTPPDRQSRKLDKRKSRSRIRDLHISSPILADPLLIDAEECVGLPQPPPRVPPRAARREIFNCSDEQPRREQFANSNGHTRVSRRDTFNRSQENLLWGGGHQQQHEALYWGTTAFPPLVGSKSLGKLDGIKEVHRLAQYEQYLEQLLSAQRDEQEEAARARAKAKEEVKTVQSDLERIQELFPSDALRLYDRDPLTMRMKGLMRKRSTTAARLHRALSAKRVDQESTETLPRDRPTKRVFLLEAPVQFTSSVQSQDRHIFLFNDLLLVAKARSGGNFKLKEKVRVSEMWLTRNALEEVSEVRKSPETSFVMGWPTTNVVATFNTQATRDLWWAKLSEVIPTERDKEPRSTNIQIRFNDVATGIEYVKTLSVGPYDTASRCIAMSLQHLEMRGRDPSAFQLWAKTSGDEAPYPLIGHERPFAIKLSCLRQGLSTEEGFDLDHCNNINGPDPYTRCQFILRNRPRDVEEPESESKKDSRKKTRKSPMRIRHVFRRSLHKDGCLFKLPLDRVFEGDMPPKPVMNMLQQVFQKGPFTQGIFRKSASARLVKDLREQLDGGADVALDVVPVLVTAALLKDFLRSLPTPLLGGAHAASWLEALSSVSPAERLTRLKMLVAQLPSQNQTLLSYFVCVLYHIARRSSHNLMTAVNLGVCVGPSLLWAPCQTTSPIVSKTVPQLVETLISHCEVVIGPHVKHLLGEPPERPPDSGAEESDSLHSGGLRRDDSSIDSLERELSEPPRKDNISLSRDSGLTMSDSQLYTPDEEETSSSSSGSGHAYTNSQYIPVQHSKVSASYSVPATAAVPTLGPSALNGNVEYVRVYGGWEERVQGCCRAPVYTPGRNNNSASSHFQRQDWFRQRSTQRKQLKPPCRTSQQAEADSSTLSDDDSTPHVSRSNSRGKDDERLVHAAPATVTVAPPLPPKRTLLRHLPPVHVDDVQDENRPPERRGRLRKRELAHKALAHRSKSLPPAEDVGGLYSRIHDSPPPYRPPPTCYQPDRRVLVDHQEESYV